VIPLQHLKARIEMLRDRSRTAVVPPAYPQMTGAASATMRLIVASHISSGALAAHLLRL